MNAQGWSASLCRCGGFANSQCHGSAQDCAATSGGPALAAYAGRHPQSYASDILANMGPAGGLEVTGTISCGLRRGGDTNLGVNQVGYAGKESKWRFEVAGDSCEVSFDACEANFDNLLRVISLDGTVEYAKNDDSAGAACCRCCRCPEAKQRSVLCFSLRAARLRGKDDDFRKSVRMHCPYSKLEPLHLSPGGYLLLVEGYSNYQGTYTVGMNCSAGCS